MTTSFSTLSKLNKNYVNSFTSGNFINFSLKTFILANTNIELLVNQYDLPRSTFYNNNSSHFNFDDQLIQSYRDSYDQTALKVNHNAYSSKVVYIYPFSYNHFKENIFTNFYSSEKEFIFSKMLDSSRILDFKTFLIINLIPYTKEEFTSITQEWDTTYSINSISSTLKSANEIINRYKKQHKELEQKVADLSTENKRLTELNNRLQQDLVRATQITW